MDEQQRVALITGAANICDEGSGFLTGQTIVVGGGSAKD